MVIACNQEVSGLLSGVGNGAVIVSLKTSLATNDTWRNYVDNNTLITELKERAKLIISAEESRKLKSTFATHIASLMLLAADRLVVIDADAIERAAKALYEFNPDFDESVNPPWDEIRQDPTAADLLMDLNSAVNVVLIAALNPESINLVSAKSVH